MHDFDLKCSMFFFFSGNLVQDFFPSGRGFMNRWFGLSVASKDARDSVYLAAFMVVCPGGGVAVLTRFMCVRALVVL